MNADELIYILRQHNFENVRLYVSEHDNTCTVCQFHIIGGCPRYEVLDCPGDIKWIICRSCFDFAKTTVAPIDSNYGLIMESTVSFKKTVDEFIRRIKK